MRIQSLLLSVVLLTACTTVGNKFDMDKVHQLQPGMSTRQDAIALLGAPTRIINSSTGKTALEWRYAQGTALGTGSAAHATIVFGSDNKMIRIADEGSTAIH